MYNVYKMQVNKDEYLDKLTTLANNLYNYAMYNVRQVFFEKKEYLNYFGNYPLCKNNENYKELPAQAAQHVLKQVDNAFQSFFKANKAYKKNPGKFLGRPKLPKYKEKGSKSTITIPGQSLKVKNKYINFPKSNYKLFTGELEIDKIVEVKIKPYRTFYEILITYENKKEYPKVEQNENYISIDLGIDNFVTITNNIDKRTIIVKGKTIKSINQFYNKKQAQLKSYIKTGTSNKLDKLTRDRNNKVEYFIHNVSKFIIDYCIENNISNIVIGKNKNWKQEVNIGTQNNQNFVSIPHSSFIFKLKYKAERYNINVIEHEESYTSKCDALALEDIKKKDEYFGKRIKRGLFKSKTGALINADVNGSLNILRKVIGNDFISLLNRGLVMNPEAIYLASNKNNKRNKEIL